MKKSIFKRLTSFLVAAVMLFTSNTFSTSIFADEGMNGVGIYNNVMTSQTTAQTEYVVTFYKTVNNGTEQAPVYDYEKVKFEPEMEFGSKVMSVAADDTGVIFLDKGDKVDFSTNGAFRNFVKKNEITKIEIQYITGTLDGKETSVLYGNNTLTYEFTESNELDYNADNPFSGKPFTKKQFDSTLMTEFTVEMDWRDHGGVERPDIDKINFDISRNNSGYITGGGTVVDNTNNTVFKYTIDDENVSGGQYTAYLNTEVKDSNTYLYTYTVPERDKNDQEYSYASTELNFPAEVVRTDNNVTTTYDTADYYKTQSQSGTDNTYLAIGLREFTCTLNWIDKAASNTARPEIDANFIKSNFTLYKKDSPDDTQVAPPNGTSWGDDIVVSTENGITTVTFKHLEDINEGGTANEYYLKLNDTDSKIKVNTSFSDQSDYYAVKSENSGLHANETDKTYENGEFDLLLTGKTSFTGTVVWKDQETTTTRTDDTSAATFDLWRYSGNEFEYSAKVGEPLTIGGNETSVTFGKDANNAPTLDKYDIQGNLYTYYAVENVTVEETSSSTLLPYEKTYANTDSNLHDADKKLYNGGTVTNKLSDKVEYTVSAEWIAAARQGGTASATYQLQIYNKASKIWVPYTYVDNTEPKNAEVTLDFNELHMSRTTDETNKFPVVDLYDETGALNQYRVVQTSVTRTDNLVPKTDNTEIGKDIIGNVTTEQKEIDVNDKYDVVLTKNGTNFDFKYTIMGDTVVNIEKKWVDENGNDLTTDSNYNAVFDVQNFDNGTQKYRDYFVESDFPNNYFNEYVNSEYFIRETVGTESHIKFNTSKTTFNNGDWEEKGIKVPKYDSAGREIDYRAIEVSKTYPPTAVIGGETKTVGFYSTYSWGVTYTGTGSLTTNYNYEITNHRTIEGNDHMYIAVNKEWVDDGELEYRQPINIIADNVGTTITKTTENGTTTYSISDDGTKTVVLNKQNVWENRINVSQYEKNEDGSYKQVNGHYVLINSYTNDMTKFSEGPVSPVSGEKYYWSKEEIESGAFSDGLKWINELLTDRKWGKDSSPLTYSTTTTTTTTTDPATGEETTTTTETQTPKNFVDLDYKNFVDFTDDFAGIYKSKPIDSSAKHCHYYAVRQVYDNNGVNGAVGTLHFINTRIGVISYEILFDWNVGDALTRANDQIRSVSVKISYTENGTDRISIVQDIAPGDLTERTDGKYAYYILNLPKYDEKGKLIDYKIEEVKINDKAPDSDGVFTVGDATNGDKCKVTISPEKITEGAEAKTDDLHTVVITNTFEDETDITVHKKWVDNSNADNTRSDLYIRLHRISSKAGSTEQKSDKEYSWTKSANDTENYWAYEFTGLEKYDSEGYPYTYYVKEQEENRLPRYKQTYTNNIYNNPKVYVSTPRTDVAYDGGLITNQLYDEVVVNGEKLWKNISNVLEKGDYPIADVTLWRDNTVIEIEKGYDSKSDTEINDEILAAKTNGKITDEVYNALKTRRQKIDKLIELTLKGMTDEQKEAHHVKIAETQVMSGATSFKFKSDEVDSQAKSNGYVIVENNVIKTDDNGSIVLPKYDEGGRRITYTMTEQPINGYVSRIEQGSTKLINEYNGGRKLKFTVTKDWKGMENEKVFPTITFTLHQVFRVPKKNTNGEIISGQYTYYVYNQFKREIRTTSTTTAAELTVTFGDSDHPAEEKALRYYSPVGEPFVYFITETLSNYDGENALLIDNQYKEYLTGSGYLNNYNDTSNTKYIYFDSNGQALGFTAEVTDSLDNTNELARAKAIESLKAVHPGDENYTPSEEEISEQIKKELGDETAEALALDETVQNTYKPDDSNFHGLIDVTKNWDGQENTEHGAVRAYSFTLSRKTKQLAEENLFTVNTIDTHSGAGAVPTLVPATGYVNVDSQGSMYVDETNNVLVGNDFKPSITNDKITEPTGSETAKYYIAYLKKTGDSSTGESAHPIMVVIDVANENGILNYNNKVHIKNLAIYGQDALKYTYMIKEEPKSGYTATKSSDKSQLEKDIVKELSLKNQLDVFDLKIYKSFGREYQDSNNDYQIEPIPAADYAQFFNDDYFKQLKFHIYRQSSNQMEKEEIGYNGEPLANDSSNLLTGQMILNGINDTSSTPNPNLTYGKSTGEKNSNRYVTIANLPLTDAKGAFYTYWVEEVDGAQLNTDGTPKTDKHVSTYYSKGSVFGETRAKNAASVSVNNEPKSVSGNSTETQISMVKADKGKTKEAYIQNVFEAKKISINKYWLDNNNEDGLRPDELTATIYEKVNDSSTPITFDRTLKNSDGWTMEAALARYYFNGTTAEQSLQYKLDEEVIPAYTKVTEAKTYPKGTKHFDSTSNTYVDDVYTVLSEPQSTYSADTAPVSDSENYKPIGTGITAGESTFDTLNLTNYKIPQKGEITLSKEVIGDTGFEADTRPSNLYFMLTDESENALTLADYNALNLTLKVGENTVSPESNGVITVPKNTTDNSYPNVTVSNLPIGSSTNGGVQANGTFVPKQYKFVECQSDGTTLADNFPYTWDGAAKGTPKTDGVYDDGYETVTLDKASQYKKDYEITNKLKTENHTVKKRWNDDDNNGTPNYYKTRPDNFYVKLQRTTKGNPTDNSDWTDVYSDDIELVTDKDNLNVDSNNYHDYSSIELFRNLPKYDSSGNKYYYRVIETFIGEKGDDRFDTSKHTYNNTYPASNVYYVEYDSNNFDTESNIQNHLIRKTKYVNFHAIKKWSDNYNQDEKRVPIKVKLTQSINGTVVNSSEETLDESNNWYYSWKNYPKCNENGVDYDYDVEEITSLTDIYTSNKTTNHSEFSTGDNSYEERIFTNTHPQETASLKVDKSWLGDGEYKALRPEKIEFVLCCKYTAYKYAIENENERIAALKAGQTLEFVEDTSKSYDGPVKYGSDEAVQLLYYYPDVTWENEYESDSTKKYYYSKTLQPDNKTDDNNWKNKITFENLPVYINTCGTDRWNGKACKIEYYVKEIVTDTDSKTYIYGVGGHVKAGETETAGYLSGETELDKDSTKTVTVTNKLNTRPIKVTKKWTGDDDFKSLRYLIDLTLECTNADEQSNFVKTHIQTTKTTDDTETVTFENVPIYDKDGTLLKYKVTESVNGGSGSTEYHQYGYKIKSAVAFVENSESEHTLTKQTGDNDVDNFTYLPAENDTNIYVEYVITNELPLVHLKADKLWNDNNNQDGMRPDELKFTLTAPGAISTDADNISVEESDKSSNYSAQNTDNKTHWEVDFGYQPAKDINNNPYVYKVTEEAATGDSLETRGYTRYVGNEPVPTGTNLKTGDYDIAQSDTNESGSVDTSTNHDTLTFHFKNYYEPKTDSLKITKEWDDILNKGTADELNFSWARPQSVTVTLCYKIGNGDYINLSEKLAAINADTTHTTTDPVIAILGNNYKYTKTINANENWQYVFTGLPLKVNTTGNAVFNGESAVITYSVVETTMNGYKTTYKKGSDNTADYKSDYKQTGTVLTDAVDELKVKNELKTKTIQVQKTWVDGYSGDQAQHYDVHLTLANTNGLTNVPNQTAIISQSGNASSNNTTSGTVSFTVPQYVEGSTHATFTVTEDSSDKKYGYVTSYSPDYSTSANAFNAATIGNDAVITVTNTLPLTEVSVTKTWEDSNNTYNLRPENITFNLYRRVVGAAEWGTTPIATKTVSKDNNNPSSQTVKFDKLPKFNESNQLYEYKVEETNVKAYDTTYKDSSNNFVNTPVTKQDDNTSNAMSFDVKNKLITAPITLIKVWNDNGCTDPKIASHYPVTFKVSNNSNNIAFTNNGKDYTFGTSIDGTTVETVNGNITWKKNTDSLPVYYKDGTPILYTVTETQQQQYGYYQTKDQSDNKIVDTTQAGTHNGYTNKYYDSYKITNELPVTTVKAVKNWAGDLEKYPNCDVTVKLTRSSNGTDDSDFNSDSNSSVNTKTIAHTQPSSDNQEFTNLLVKDSSNNPYTYTITEQTVQGYSTKYSVNGTETQQVDATKTDLADRTVTITNTPILQNVDFVKYDVTDLEKHGTESNFKLVTLSGAKFELYRTFSGKVDKKIYVKQKTSGTDGEYVVVESSDSNSTDTLISGTNGVIKIEGLEPNDYYLLEKSSETNGGAPTGYQPSTVKFSFTVSVDAQNNRTITYVKKEVTKSSTGLNLDNSAFSTETAKSAFTDFTNMSFAYGNTPPSNYGIPNEENMSKLTLTKVDKTDVTNNVADPQKLSNAYYYLLRLVNFEYRKDTENYDQSTEEAKKAKYLENALAVLNENLDVKTNPYWEKVGEPYYVTGNDGKINVTGHMFGTYVFYEVKSPVGYDRDFTYDTNYVATNANFLGPVEFKSDNANHDNVVYNLTHLEPRKKAHIKILKTDENGNPLKDAKFELYKEVPGGTDEKINTDEIKTGYDGMNQTEIVLDAAAYEWDTKFYFIEVNPPKGYSADNDVADKTKIEFTLTRELADETLHIVRANDSRLKGKVTLTKVSSADAFGGTVKAGDKLGGAVFELYKKDGNSATKLNVYVNSTDTTKYRVAVAGEDKALITDYNTEITQDTLTTGNDGRLDIENLDWGDYYLQEKTPPTGFKLPSTDEEKRVYFSVGRTNCGDTPQELTMKNEPLTAQLNIAKHIDILNTEAWGETTFIFKIRQTEYYNHTNSRFETIAEASQSTMTKAITVKNAVTDGFENETGKFEVEPGTYVITEVQVARYSPDGNAEITETISGKVTPGTLTGKSATLSIQPGGDATVTFKNKLTNYEKQSHADIKTNTFNGYKAIKVSDKDDLSLNTAVADGKYSVTIEKSELSPKLIKSDGNLKDITDYQKLVISIPDTDTETKAEIAVTNNDDNIVVTGRKEDVSGSIYKLKATYDGKFTTTFELRFKADPLQVKKEITVTFVNDDDNKSHYEYGSTDIGRVYTLNVIMYDGNVKSILYNGTSTGKTDKSAFMKLEVDSLYSNEVEFDKWSYKIGGTGTETDAANIDALFDAIKSADNKSVITVKAVLKTKTQP